MFCITWVWSWKKYFFISLDKSSISLRSQVQKPGHFDQTCILTIISLVPLKISFFRNFRSKFVEDYLSQIAKFKFRFACHYIFVQFLFVSKRVPFLAVFRANRNSKSFSWKHTTFVHNFLGSLGTNGSSDFEWKTELGLSLLLCKLSRNISGMKSGDDII